MCCRLQRNSLLSYCERHRRVYFPLHLVPCSPSRKICLAPYKHQSSDHSRPHQTSIHQISHHTRSQHTRCQTTPDLNTPNLTPHQISGHTRSQVTADLLTSSASGASPAYHRLYHASRGGHMTWQQRIYNFRHLKIDLEY